MRACGAPLVSVIGSSCPVLGARARARKRLTSFEFPKMGDAPTEISIRLAYWGPPGTGKTASIERFAERIRTELPLKPDAAAKMPVLSFNAPDGSTLLYDYFAFDMGLLEKANAELRIELY